jgi:arylformamidase
MLIDISPAIRPSLPVWPGDAPVEFERTWSIGPACPVNVSKISLSTHTGAHVDAPFHFDAHGQTIDEVALDTYVGWCRVIHVIGSRGTIMPQQVAGHVEGCPPRVIFRTYEKAPQGAWDSAFCAIAPETIDLLAAGACGWWGWTLRRSIRKARRPWMPTWRFAVTAWSSWKAWCWTPWPRATTN